VGGGCELHSSGSGQSPVAGSCEDNNEPSACIREGNFLISWASISCSRKQLFYGDSELNFEEFMNEA
jgi:hypothetical protein